MNVTLQSLKSLDRQGLTQAIFDEIDLKDYEFHKLSAAIDLAGLLHSEQIRKEVIQGRASTPYIEHPLRNTLRMIRWGVTDLDVLVATVLHDTIEDCGQMYVKTHTSRDNVSNLEARELLTEHITRYFGFKVREIVLGVTNPYYTRKEWFAFTPDEKRENYRVTVSKEIAANGEVYLVKLSDFVDNAGSLHWTPRDRHHVAHRLASKYFPLIEVFREYADKHDFSQHINDFTKEVLKLRLDTIEGQLQEILTRTD